MGFYGVPASIVDRVRPGSVDDMSVFQFGIDIDKNWGVIHYLLTDQRTGGQPPACYLLSGGADLTRDKFYGSVPQRRLLAPLQVLDFARHLKSISEAELDHRFSTLGPAMVKAEVYGAFWPPIEPKPGVEGIISTRQGLAWNFNALKKYFSELAAKGMGCIISLE